MDEFVYVIADWEYDDWARGVDDRAGIKKGQVYKGILLYNTSLMGKNPNGHHGWNYGDPPFRLISKVEALVLSRGDIRWLP